MRVFIARVFITLGMMLLPADVRKMVRGLMLFHVPGALTEHEKADVVSAKADWLRRSQPPRSEEDGK
jgi:hypothetical protein